MKENLIALFALSVLFAFGVFVGRATVQTSVAELELIVLKQGAEQQQINLQIQSAFNQFHGEANEL